MTHWVTEPTERTTADKEGRRASPGSGVRRRGGNDGKGMKGSGAGAGAEHRMRGVGNGTWKRAASWATWVVSVRSKVRKERRAKPLKGLGPFPKGDWGRGHTDIRREQKGERSPGRGGDGGIGGSDGGSVGCVGDRRRQGGGGGRSGAGYGRGRGERDTRCQGNRGGGRREEGRSGAWVGWEGAGEGVGGRRIRVSIHVNHLSLFTCCRRACRSALRGESGGRRPM
jgi:hypothetical protein